MCESSAITSLGNDISGSNIDTCRREIFFHMMDRLCLRLKYNIPNLAIS
jgi:hypothetical protein